MNTSTISLSSRWAALLAPYADEVTILALYENLMQLYGEPHRSYHTLKHIDALFSTTEALGLKFQQPEVIAWATWYHDAIYDPKKKNNEERSADLAVQTMSLFAPRLDKMLDTVWNLIMSTQAHYPINDSPDCRLFLDLDLAIFGAEAEVYDKYSAGIRKEYAYVPDFIYKMGRKTALQKFFSRKPLYFTDIFREQFEARAKENLAREIASL
jgi:predicted metal-dependent HD superfamily phosphohydrolase